jgi:hypothetical protein
LRADIEAHYVSWYLTNVAAWGTFSKAPGAAHELANRGSNQFRFYDRSITAWLRRRTARAFVISDAFRCEAARTHRDLNGRKRFAATLSSQRRVTVMPALGMASLLPHKTLAYKGTDMLVDGQSSIASERDGILQGVRRAGLQGRRLDGEEEGRRSGIRQGSASRLHLSQHGGFVGDDARRKGYVRDRAPGNSTNWRRWLATSSTT